MGQGTCPRVPSNNCWAYTLMVFGVDDIKVDGKIEEYIHLDILEYSLKAICYGFQNISQGSLFNVKMEMIYCLLQFLIGLYGGAVSAYVTKTVFSNVE